MMIDLCIALSLFFVAYIAGYWAIYQGGHRENAHIDAIAAGIFLGAALFHMLPDAVRLINSRALISPKTAMIIIITMLSMVMMYSLSKFLQRYRFSLTPQLLSGLLVTVLLGVHSLIEGLTLGFSTQLHVIFILCLAILFHKSAASFALANHLRYNQYSQKQSHLIIFIFALLTPFGIILGNCYQQTSTHHHDDKLNAIFLAITAGTFLYISIYEYLIPKYFIKKSQPKLKPLSYSLAGFIIMALLSLKV